MIQVFSHFLKYFPLVSHHSCFTCVLVVLSCVVEWCAPKALFLGLELKFQWCLLEHQASCLATVTDYIKRHQMKTYFALLSYWSLVGGINRWIPFTKGRYYGLLIFLCCLSELNVQTHDWPVIRDSITVTWHRRNIYQFVCICASITK